MIYLQQQRSIGLRPRGTEDSRSKTVYALHRFQEWGPIVTETLDPSKPTVVLCHHGVRSFRAASFLVSQVQLRIPSLYVVVAALLNTVGCSPS